MIRVNESMVGTRLSPDGGLDGLAIAGSHISKKNGGDHEASVSWLNSSLLKNRDG